MCRHLQHNASAVSRSLLAIALVFLFCACSQAAQVRNYFIRADTGNVDTNKLTITQISTNILASGGVTTIGVPIPVPRSPYTNYLAQGFYSVSNAVLRRAYVINVWDNSDTLYDYTNFLHSGYNTYVVQNPDLGDVIDAIGYQPQPASVNLSNWSTLATNVIGTGTGSGDTFHQTNAAAGGYTNKFGGVWTVAGLTRSTNGFAWPRYSLQQDGATFRLRDDSVVEDVIIYDPGASRTTFGENVTVGEDLHINDQLRAANITNAGVTSSLVGSDANGKQLPVTINGAPYVAFADGELTFTAIPLSSLGQSSATLGQVPKWDGGAWVPDDDLNSGGGIEKASGNGTNTTFFTTDNNPVPTGAAQTLKPLETSVNPGLAAKMVEQVPPWTNQYGVTPVYREVFSVATNVNSTATNHDIIFTRSMNFGGNSAGVSTFGPTATNYAGWGEQYELEWYNAGTANLGRLEVWKGWSTPYTIWGTNYTFRFLGFDLIFDRDTHAFHSSYGNFNIGQFDFINPRGPGTYGVNITAVGATTRAMNINIEGTVLSYTNDAGLGGFTAKGGRFTAGAPDSVSANNTVLATDWNDGLGVKPHSILYPSGVIKQLHIGFPGVAANNFSNVVVNTNLTVTGNASVALNLTVDGAVSVGGPLSSDSLITGTATADNFNGDGSGLTGIPLSALTVLPYSPNDTRQVTFKGQGLWIGSPAGNSTLVFTNALRARLTLMQDTTEGFEVSVQGDAGLFDLKIETNRITAANATISTNASVGEGVFNQFNRSTNFVAIHSNSPSAWLATPLTYGEILLINSNGTLYQKKATISGSLAWASTNEFGGSSSAANIEDVLIEGSNANGQSVSNLLNIHATGNATIGKKLLVGSSVVSHPEHASIAGGVNHNILGSNHWSFIGGGNSNHIAAGTSAGGYNTIGGGTRNYIGYHSTNSGNVGGAFIGGGEGNRIFDNGSDAEVIAGGIDNTIATGPLSAIGGGHDNLISGSLTEGATIPGGGQNFVGGAYSAAMGRRAGATNDNSFVWSDGTAFGSTAANQFVVRATGGFGINTNSMSGAALSVHGTIAASSITPGAGGLHSTNGNNTFNPFLGTVAADNAPAGTYGEYVESKIAVGSAVSLTTATAANITSISLTAGDWDVQGKVTLTAGSATFTAGAGGINTTTATIPTDGSESYCGNQTTTTSFIESMTLDRKRINVSSTTTVYLVGRATFSAGTVGGFGQITARRVR